MPFHLSTTLVDKIAQALTKAIPSTSIPAATPLVFLTRNIDWFSKSAVLRSAFKGGDLPKKVVAIDVRGYVLICDDRNENWATKSLTRASFQRALRVQQNTFYESLIRETKFYLGHFALENSHIRTHYDLNEFVRRDNVLEHLNALLGSLIDGYEQVTILGVGLERNAVMHLGYQFYSLNSARILGFEPLAGEQPEYEKVAKLCQQSD